MKKYIFKPTGEEIKIGDEISFLFVPEFIEAFKKMGIIKEKNIFKPNLDFHYYREKLAKRIGLSWENYLSWENATSKSASPILLQALLKEVALELDQKYDGHISDAKEKWYIDINRGTAIKGIGDPVHYYSSIFRSKEDAELACTIMNPLMKLYYGESKDKERKS